MDKAGFIEHAGFGAADQGEAEGDGPYAEQRDDEQQPSAALRGKKDGHKGQDEEERSRNLGPDLVERIQRDPVLARLLPGRGGQEAVEEQNRDEAGARQDDYRRQPPFAVLKLRRRLAVCIFIRQLIPQPVLYPVAGGGGRRTAVGAEDGILEAEGLMAVVAVGQL